MSEEKTNSLTATPLEEPVAETPVDCTPTEIENATNGTDIKPETSELVVEEAVNDDTTNDRKDTIGISTESETVPYTEIRISKEESSSSSIVPKMADSLAYRVDCDGANSEDSSDDSDDSSSSSTSSDSGLEDKKGSLSACSDRDDEDDEKPGKKKKGPSNIRTKGELCPEELPPLEELKISVDEAVEMQEVGRVASTVGVLVVIQANKDIPALNEETVLFTENREAFGKIFEVFGPVASPFYSVRFNSPEDIDSKNISAGVPLYCAPKEQEYTQFVFVEQLKKIKGSDASWENNNEPPNSCVDFSDDEDEKRMKAKNRNRTPIEGTNEDQGINKKGRNRKKHQRFENKMGNNQEHGREHTNQQGGRGRRQWPPKKNDSWPPRDSSGWPPRAQESWPSGNGDCDWQTTARQFGPRGPSSHSFMNPGSFPGGRGMNRHPGTSPRFQNAYQQNQMRDGPPPHHGIPSHNFRDGPYQHHPEGFAQDHFYELDGNYNVANTNILMDTRLVQNPNHNADAPPFGMTRPPHPRSTFGGQPQFTPGPMGQYNQRPGMQGMGKFSNGPPGRW